jgi:hypothetical protein
MIYKVATEQAAEQAADRPDVGGSDRPTPPLPTERPASPPSPSPRRADDTAFGGTADGAVERRESPERRSAAGDATGAP